ncbi:22K [Fowl aviadenovirus 5]|uniref:22K n=1 Tax=Fowl aviadenovirus 5 TaxID=172861 RepID=R4MS34_9ADEN|nr:22K [Fowl aviadenovirus 5]AGL34691.1 22K [Fowl aviadenovirus 5]
MAQKMIDEKTRIVEELPADENAVPFPTNLRAPYGEEEDSERSRETDGESLGSEDTEEEDPLTPISEEEEEELEDEEKENVPPPSQHRKRRRSAFSPDETLTRPPIKNQKKKKLRSSEQAEPAPQSARRKRRGNYRSWVRHRVAICQALRDAVFDKKFAAEILKRAKRLFVPPGVLSYYARRLLERGDDGDVLFSASSLSL